MNGLGSIWGKWDLQVCTRFYNNYGGITLDGDELSTLKSITGLSTKQINSDHQSLTDEEYAKLFVEYIANCTDLSVVAIMNHNIGLGTQSIRDYLELKRNTSGGRYNEIEILPGVEIGTSDRCHSLIVFNPDSEHRERFRYDQEGKKISKLTWDDYIEKFLDEVKIPSPRFSPGKKPSSSSTLCLLELLNLADEWDFIPIMPHINDKCGLFQELSNSNRIEVYSHRNFGIVDSFTVGKNQSLQKVLNGEDVNYGNKFIAQINTSDAKSLKEIGSKFTWIKSENTFDGLRQIIFEPKERVSISAENPYNNNQKVFFSKIKLEGGVQFPIKESDLILNRELVAIIGGRGSGKSTLLECFAMMNEEHIKNDSNGKPKIIEFFRNNPEGLIPKPNLLVSADLVDKNKQTHTYSKNLDENVSLELPFLYIGQEQLSLISTNDKELTKRVCELINLSNDLESESALTQVARDSLSRIDSSRYELGNIGKRYQDFTSGDFISWIDERINKKKEQFKRLTSESTQEILGKMTEILNTAGKIKRIQEKVYSLEDSINALVLNDEIKSINTEIAEILPPSKVVQIPEILTSNILEKGKSFHGLALDELEALRGTYLAYKQKLMEKGIKEDVATLVQSTEQIQKEITNMVQDRDDFAKLKVSLDEEIRNRNVILDKITDYLKSSAKQLTDTYDEFKNSRNDAGLNEKATFDTLLEGISIKGEILFNEEIFLNFVLNECFDRRKYGNKHEIKTSIAGADSKGNANRITWNVLIKWIKDRVDTLNDSNFFNSNGYNTLITSVFTGWQKFVSVRALVTLEGIPTDKLSIGQRGTLLLKIYLATANAREICIIDQPEDNLDNRFIVNKLVPLLRKLKKSRQIIISTHNANLAINTDAEQVIIARLDEAGSYISGGIENKVINKLMQEILEGGEEAFKKRKEKYYISI